MICKIIEDDYSFEQIESIEAIENLEKEHNLTIRMEDKTFPFFYPEIGFQTSYKVFKNDRLIAFSGFQFYFYDIADLTSFDISKICKFKVKHFPKQYKINIDLLKFGAIGSIWYLMENKWWSCFTTENKRLFLHEETFEEIFLSQEFNKKNYKDLVKLLKYSKQVRTPIVEMMYKYIQLHNYPISSYGRCEKLLLKYTNYFKTIDYPTTNYYRKLCTNKTLDDKMLEKLNEIKQIINEAEAILITAGAGMGVDSGLPDFRGNEGFWNAYPIAKKLNLGFQDLANPIWFTTSPFLAWAFYGHRYNLYKNTIPHDGFKMLLDLAKSKNDNYFIFTSNVDGQFQKAGFDENKIVECHGSISHFQCINDCKKDIWKSDIEKIDVDMEEFLATDIPLCPKCGDIARPNILMFGDWKWNAKRTLNQETRYNKWKKQNKSKKLLVIELGAGTAIPTVRRESENIAKYYNGNLIRINPKEFDVDSDYGFSIPFGALEGLKAIF